MPRGIPWEELPRPYPYKSKPENQILDENKIMQEADELNSKPRNYLQDFDQIGRRVAFGVIVSDIKIES